MRSALALALVVAVTAGAGGAASRAAPDPSVQAMADGCARNVGALFTRDAPTWVYVNDKDDAPVGAPPPQWVRGVVSSGGRPLSYGVHPAAVDDPLTHDSYDIILNIRPDAAYSDLLGGDPARRTGNFEGDGEERGRLHTELEQNAFRPFAWPEAGDRVVVGGSWVWDCGHWQPGGERTEFHPFRVLWLVRNLGPGGAGPSPRSPYGESEADLLITTDKTPAGKSADCAHKTKESRTTFKSCLQSEPNWYDVGGSYDLTLQVPPRPFPRAKLRVRVVDAGSVNAPPVSVGVQGRVVRVSAKVDAAGGKRVVVAKRVLAGWWPLSAAMLPVHLRVTFDELLVRRAMDPGCPPSDRNCSTAQTTQKGQNTFSPGEWILYSDVAGVWSQWPLLRPRDGQRFAVRRKVEVYVARGRPWRLFLFARECDFGLLSASDPTRGPAPCPRSAEVGDLIGDDAPGSVVVRHRSPLPVARRRANSLLEASSCPQANRSGCYQLTYSVEVVDDAATRAKRR